MIMFDVNVLIYAYRPDMPHHTSAVDVLEGVLSGRDLVGVSNQVLASFVRIVANPRTFNTPMSLDTAPAVSSTLRAHPNVTQVEPGQRHWWILCGLCRKTNVKANGVTDAWLAALALENDAHWVSFDQDFRKFTGLKWLNPPGKSP